MKRRLAVLAVTTALAFGSTIGVASATGDTPPDPEPKVHCNNGVGNGPDCRPGKAHFNNDDVEPFDTEGRPGSPGSRGGHNGFNAYHNHGL